MIQRRPTWLLLVLHNRPKTSFTVVLASTNPSVVFDNGVPGPASPLPLMGFGGSQVQVKEEGESDIWDAYHWKQRTGDLFFDQVAELETIPPVYDNPKSVDAFTSYHSLGEDVLKNWSTKDPPKVLFENIEDLELSSSVASSPYLPSSPSSDSKDSSDDLNSEKDKEVNKPGNKRKRKVDELATPSTSYKILDKRIRNNQASKKFRHLRKGRHKALFDQLQYLENENYMLKVQLEQIVKEMNQLKSVLPDSTSNACISLLE